MTRADMDEVCAAFVASARMADRAGLDWLELHGAHGYLLSAFLTPLTNRRTDEYGGSLENRMRFPLEVFRAVRAVWPEGKPMSVRISAHDWVGAAGIMPRDAVDVGRLFGEAGADLIDVSAGQTSIDARPVYGRMFQTPFSDRIRNQARLATMAVGNTRMNLPASPGSISRGRKAKISVTVQPRMASKICRVASSAACARGLPSRRW